MQNQLTTYLSAGYPGLAVISSEEARAEAEIATACTSLKRLLHADGIKKVKIAELSSESKTALNLATQPTDPIALSHTNASDVAQNPAEIVTVGAPSTTEDSNPTGTNVKTKAGDDLGKKIAAIGNGIQNNDDAESGAL